MLPGQPFGTAKPLLGVILLIVKDVFKLLCKVMVWGVLVVPTPTLPKGRPLGGEKVTGWVPLLFRDAVCACRCVAEPKANKQKLANTNRRVRQLISHLSESAMCTSVRKIESIEESKILVRVHRKPDDCLMELLLSLNAKFEPELAHAR